MKPTVQVTPQQPVKSYCCLSAPTTLLSPPVSPQLQVGSTLTTKSTQEQGNSGSGFLDLGDFGKYGPKLSVQSVAEFSRGISRERWCLVFRIRIAGQLSRIRIATMDFKESSLVISMSKYELKSYYRYEISKIKREYRCEMSKIKGEHERALQEKTEENKKLKEEIESSCTLIKEKDELLSKFQDLKEKHDTQNDMMKDKLKDQARLLEETLRQLNEALTKTEKEKSRLHDLLGEKSRELSLVLEKQEVHAKSMMDTITDAISQFEGTMSIRIESNKSRLKMVSNELNKLVRLYKQAFERKCYEVDLLGDEFDALSRLLEKICIALDHYSLVLQYYPGVMEILQLIRRRLRRNQSLPR